MLIPVIMAGGSGTRLWPMSRKYLPKQFLPLTSEKTMLQETLLRLDGLDIAKPIIVVGDEHRFLAAEQLREIGLEADILLEPEGKNTAPAIALAANFALTRTGDGSIDPSPSKANACLLVLAADHVIQKPEVFHEAISQAEQVAKAGELVTFGIVPTEPHTGYGYIERGQTFSSDPSIKASKVASFVEKPDAETAQKYLDSGDYLWNSGMFLFQAQTFLDELENFSPDISGPCKEAIRNAQQDLDFIRVDVEAFATSAEDSIDYAVMEKSHTVSVIPLDAGWNDVGSWTSLWDISDKDADGNVLKSCEAIIENSQNCMLVGEATAEDHKAGRLISAIGVKDLIVVDTKDALLVANKNEVQEVKKVVEKIKSSGSGQHEFHRVVYRPWGNYDSIDSGDRFQVKRITVKPGEKLSLQKHYHRAEHWVVVAGTAKVQRDNETIILSENESIYLPVGCVHSLENPGKILLELIEVQSGAYLGEDDIVRFEDKYGRNK